MFDHNCNAVASGWRSADQPREGAWLRRGAASAIVAAGVFVAGARGASAVTVSEIYPPTPLPPGGFGDFQTPIDVYQGAVYEADVEAPPSPTVLNLHTVVRKGVQTASGGWQWTETIVEPNTADDPWHTQPSLAVDKQGYIHVAYNMHNMPWQYSVSAKPGDISSFVFRGEKVTPGQLATLEVTNQNISKYFGSAAIPGTMITYPVFAKDRNGELYISYRFAEKPGQSAQVDQVFAGAVAHYDTNAKQWQAIGGSVPVTSADGITPSGSPPVTSVTAFASTWGQWVDNLQLFFDHSNAMHAVWDWEDYRLGDNRPLTFTHAYSTTQGASFARESGSGLALPVVMGASDTIVTTNPGQQSTASLVQDATGRLGYVAVAPGTGYQDYVWNASAAQWSILGKSPLGTWMVREDGVGGLVAIGTGPIIQRSPSGALSGPWTTIYSENDGWSYPMLATDPASKAVYIRLQKCVGFVARPLPGSTPSQGTCQMRILRVGL